MGAQADALSGKEKESFLSLWRRLQTSDHFYYMSTKSGPDGEVHRHFSPFPSPYDAFIAFMNVTRDVMGRYGSEVSSMSPLCA